MDISFVPDLVLVAGEKQAESGPGWWSGEAGTAPALPRCLPDAGRGSDWALKGPSEKGQNNTKRRGWHSDRLRYWDL